MRNTVNTPNAAASSLKGQRGFTLVEMAIVTMIIGLIIAATAQLMTQRQHWLQKQRTETAVATANNAISGFRDTYGRYPCPASLSAVAGDPFYGIESDCSDVATVAEGTGVDAALGYARVVSDPTTLGDPARVVTYFDKNLGADVGPVAPRIRIGTLPFKNLNLEETSILDGYGNRIIYAVTEQMAVSDTYEDDDGGIIILNDQGDSIVAPDHSAHFLILSSGENGNGAYTYGGGRLPCTAGSLESDNCNFDADAIFRFAQTSTRAAGNANTYDDVITYATQQSTPLWEKTPTASNSARQDTTTLP